MEIAKTTSVGNMCSKSVLFVHPPPLPPLYWLHKQDGAGEHVTGQDVIILEYCTTQSTYTYKEFHRHSLCPLVGVGTLPTTRSPASVPLPPEPREKVKAGGERTSKEGKIGHVLFSTVESSRLKEKQPPNFPGTLSLWFVGY